MSCYEEQSHNNCDNQKNIDDINLNDPIHRLYESSIDIFNSDENLPCSHKDPRLNYDFSTEIDSKHSHINARQNSDYMIDYEDYEMKPLSNEIELIFRQISHSITSETIEDKQILKDIDGYASPGQILAVMGPSGSGKTTFLNILSGRTKSCSGEILLNGQLMNKQLRRKMCYVLQQDIFFPNLTLKQTLMYSARLRLSDSISDKEKFKAVERIIEELQLTNCQDTIIGDFCKRGLSGGEKKRANIACELITNPSILLVDEPTSGLDSCTAYNLIKLLKNFASKNKKTLVMSIHQPSSQMFYLLDNLLLLGDGELAYFGNVKGIIPFFKTIGFTFDLHYNPAEFVLEKIMNPQLHKKIVEEARKLSKFPHHHHHHHHQHHHHHHHQQNHHEAKSIDDEGNSQTNHSNSPIAMPKIDSWKKDSLKSIEINDHIEDHQNSHIFHDNDSGRSSWSEPDRCSTFSSISSSFKEEILHNKTKQRKWPTSFWTQIKVLTERNFVESKHRMLSKLNWIQTIILAIVAGLIWFQIERKEETLNDIRGWMFFTTTYWMLFGLFQALVSFPPEREVINKERWSGAYRLSSYYIAKMIGELPLTIALPTVFFIISYPMLGCHSIITFLYLWFFLIISTICAQSFGLFIGATCYDLEVSVTISALYSLSTMLFAGYYTSMPAWLSWGRYFSIVFYSFQNMQIIEFKHSNIVCSESVSKFASCQNSSMISLNPFIDFGELELQLDPMNMNSKPLPLWFNSLMLILFLIVFRSAAYLVLRFARKPFSS
ncbi:forkhead box protein L2 [Sarcoptes scabiei]|nr:forkhead box protein L2 [Sarcoptes scabiei]